MIISRCNYDDEIAVSEMDIGQRSKAFIWPTQTHRPILTEPTRPLKSLPGNPTQPIRCANFKFTGLRFVASLCDKLQKQ